MTTMAETKFVDNQLQSFDIQAKPPITHTQVEQLQKVSEWNARDRPEFHPLLSSSSRRLRG